MTDMNQKHCIIDNLAIKLPGSFRTRSIHNPSGDQSATTIQNGAEILSTIYDIEAMEEDDWDYMDEVQGPATAMEAHQQASQSVAVFSPQQTPQPETKGDIEMEEVTNVVTIGLRTPSAEFLRMQNEDPSAKSQTEYPGSLESFKNQFTTWYKHRQSNKDHMPTPKSKQRKAIYFATVCLKLDYEKFFQARMHLSYFEVLYELTLGMSIQFDMRSDDEKHKKQPVLLIPFVQEPNSTRTTFNRRHGMTGIGRMRPYPTSPEKHFWPSSTLTLESSRGCQLT
jgi:hypothetical protein